MSVQIDRSGIVNNDLTFDCQILYQGAAQPLTGLTVSIVVKASRTATDASGTTYAAGSGITITNSALGEFTWFIPRASNTKTGVSWYRIDVTNATGDVTTAAYGNLEINAA